MASILKPPPPPCFHRNSISISSSSSPVILSTPFHRTASLQVRFCALRTGSDGGRIGSQESYGADLLGKPSILPEDSGGNSEEEEGTAVKRKRSEWKDWEDRILEDTVPLVGFVRMIIHSGRYQSGDRLSPEHESTILERLLPYHPECDKKIGCGIDYITVGYHPDFEGSRYLMGTNMNFKNFGNTITPQSTDGGGNKLPTGIPLTRQTSIYSLTFDEFQSSMGGIGKDFGSMNMDELLKNIWSAEETQTMASSTTAVQGNGGLQRQGSLTLPRTLSQKTVDEVWKDISKEYSIGKDGIAAATTNNMPQTQRQQTLGEITLEEFLVRAGVVREDTQLAGKANNNGGFFGELQQTGNNIGFGIGFQQGNRGQNFMGNRISEGGNQIGVQASNLPLNVNGVRSNQQQLAQQQTQQHQQPIFPKQPAMTYGAQIPLQSGGQLGSPGIRGGIAGIGDQGLTNGLLHGGGMGMVGLGGAVTVATGSPANQLSSDGIGKSSGDTSSVSPVPYVFNGSLRGRKSSAVEKVVERRQRRMIKNRESAARSRARKQAYTMELEAEVAKLKEENQELRKKHAEALEMQKNQVMEMMNMEQGGKKRCLRRTQTGPW
ncbi:hypothetical protein COLO4_26519 [Corchorus olitorius]|uniref:BZIP domain-containing protein n=1 Tax=Corchorus olitorius TaxID=93759 RepID=A0A1R3HWW2_9ROSI|nr:hypothetical protein COLO4_26519 [Corchorus olitorius]